MSDEVCSCNVVFAVVAVVAAVTVVVRQDCHGRCHCGVVVIFDEVLSKEIWNSSRLKSISLYVPVSPTKQRT